MARAGYYKLIAENRKARFDYIVIEAYKAGLVLEGSEVKSVRLGEVNLRDSFARAVKDELFLFGVHIKPYGGSKLDPVRPRKVLLKKREMVKLLAKAAEKGLTIVPLKIYLDGNWVKVDLGLGKAKRKFEKRETLRRRETEKEIKAVFKGETYGRQRAKDLHRS